jgi:hypothetical protein
VVMSYACANQLLYIIESICHLLDMTSTVLLVIGWGLSEKKHEHRPF